MHEHWDLERWLGDLGHLELLQMLLAPLSASTTVSDCGHTCTAHPYMQANTQIYKRGVNKPFKIV